MALKTTALFISLLANIFVFGQQAITVDWTEYYSRIQKADSIFQSRNYLSAAQAYSKAFAFNNQNFVAGHRYQAARAWALSEEKDSTISNLKKEIELLNFSDFEKLINDTAFLFLHKHIEWDEITQKVRVNREAESKKLGKYAEVKKRLEEIYELDQKYRTDYMNLWQKYGGESVVIKDIQKKMRIQDSLNFVYIDSIISKYGWVGYDTIGHRANQAIFLVIQHADSASQEKYLPVMKKAVNENRAFGFHLALLEDRVLMKRGEKQIYGSQINCDETGKNCNVWPIADEKNVDKRRAEVGLEPLAEYLKGWSISYEKPR